MAALGWIMYDRPVDCVDSALSGAQYHGNTVLRTYKEKDPNHAKYIQSYYKILQALSAYVKKHFKLGLTWNNKDGVDALDALNDLKTGKSMSGSGTATPRANTSNGAPPPPPPPPLPKFDDSGNLVGPNIKSSQGGDMTAIFDQLNQGSSVTSGLRKVDKSEMTHKNPSLRAAAIPQPQRSSSSSSSGRGKSPLPGPKPSSLKSKKPPRKELDGTKWIVENYENTGSEIIDILVSMNQTILVSKCTKCVIKVTGKANAISIDNCVGLSILVENLVSSIDVIKSSKFAVQIDGTLPTILMDSVDGAQVYLGTNSMKSPPEIITSKCSAVNIVTPPVGEEDDSKEVALPEQLRSYFKNGKLITEVVEHAG
ncbi:hypothetical protein BT93_L4873 [Corymbia citriodora subsp. variegata]|uniref:C-CAP/cofactor C-like domain-containing protein n=1 Tax=Corymbia citriodora subsp. variegata TaxID=360336 RepID=A0A8T0CFE0_CORYI|nr:hypothetical protein BT93_L4873 [Corymbia citriodora subsp. variegata]